MLAARRFSASSAAGRGDDVGAIVRIVGALSENRAIAIRRPAQRVGKVFQLGHQHVNHLALALQAGRGR